jgi:GMP synthase-like glutamine amidotransferase
MQQPEIGVLDVETLPGAAEDALLAGLPARAKAVQWHLNAILELPPGASLLMRSTAWENQAIRLGRAVYGLQFHMELSADMVQAVDAYPEYVAALEAQHGEGALARLVDDTEYHSADMSRSIRLIYDNFVKLARG